MEKPNALIVGGTRGLGLELAQKLSETHRVCVVGRKDPNSLIISKFIKFDLTGWNSGTAAYLLNQTGGVIDLFIFNAGFFQNKTIEKLNYKDIWDMTVLGLLAPMDFLSAILLYQKQLPGFIAVTSTSQSRPKPNESVYCAVKSGLAHFARSVSFNPKINKVMVAAPAGMRTGFFNDGRDMSTYLDPGWVAEQIITNYHLDDFKYKEIYILREPPRIEIVEKRTE